MRRSRSVAWASGSLMLVVALVGAARDARAQGVPAGRYAPSYRVSDYLDSPGLYGMSYGFASYGMPQTYSVFSTMPGASRGATLPPYGILPGRYGVGLWRPGFATPGYVYGASYLYPPSGGSYRTFAVGSGSFWGGNRAVTPPPVGIYAPALGPATLYGW